MSNYTVITDWDGKDALADSNPAKVISGDEFQDEFDAISTAVATKADINGSASETFSASTAAAGTNTTQVATTAFVTTAVANAEAFPVGSVFISVVSTDPATLLGYGTWSAFAQGKMLVGIDSTDTDFDTVEETGGAKTHTLTTDEMPEHYHSTNLRIEAAGQVGSEATLDIDLAYDSGLGSSGGYVDHEYGSVSTSTYTQTTGGGSAHDIMNPYIVTYMWKRTA